MNSSGPLAEPLGGMLGGFCNIVGPWEWPEWPTSRWNVLISDSGIGTDGHIPSLHPF